MLSLSTIFCVINVVLMKAKDVFIVTNTLEDNIR